VPAAAVIPAPIAYIKVVAVKKLVVETLQVEMGHLFEIVLCLHWHKSDPLNGQPLSIRNCYFEKIRVFQAGVMP
jgi:hypothetical protein